LLSGFLLLPFTGERIALFSLALPWFVLGLTSLSRLVRTRSSMSSLYVVTCLLLTVSSIVLALRAKGSEQQYEYRQVKRDSTATVVAVGSTHESKRLLVNGIGMTTLSPNAKIMVHLPM